MNPLLGAIVLQSPRGGLHGRQSGSPPEARGARMAPPSVAQGDDARRLVARGRAPPLVGPLQPEADAVVPALRPLGIVVRVPAARSEDPRMARGLHAHS